MRKERRKMMSRFTVVTPPNWGPQIPFSGPSNWIPPGPGIIGGDYDLYPNFPGMNVDLSETFFFKFYTQQSQLFMTMKKKPFENMGKGENAGNQPFVFFPQGFLPCLT